MKVRVKFKKYGPVRFIGHLDVMRFFQKAVKTAICLHSRKLIEMYWSKLNEIMQNICENSKYSVVISPLWEGTISTYIFISFGSQ